MKKPHGNTGKIKDRSLFSYMEESFPGQATLPACENFRKMILDNFLRFAYEYEINDVEDLLLNPTQAIKFCSEIRSIMSCEGAIVDAKESLILRQLLYWRKVKPGTFKRKRK